MKKSAFLTAIFCAVAVPTACGKGGGDSAGGDEDAVGDGDGGASGDGDAGGDGDGDGDSGGDGDGDGDTGGDGDSSMGGAPAGDGDGDGTGGGTPVDPSAPTCTILSPDSGTSMPFFGGRTNGGEPTGIEFTAEASDAEDGTLSGDSVIWRRVGSGAPIGSGLTIIVDELPPGGNEITCTATDSDLKTGSDSITVTSLSPVLYINHPGATDGNRVAGNDVPFVGVGFDYEDGQLNSDTFTWESDLDGSLGTGNGNYPLNTVGSHVVTVSGEDSDQNEATATVVVPIVAP